MRAHGACLVTVFLLLFSATLTASESRLYRFEHRRWTDADAAPSQIGALAQTRDGHLWLGTNDSLHRFDGQEFTRYVPPDGEPLGIISSLKAVDQGLWVGLRTGGVSFIDESGIIRYPAGTGLPRGVVYGIAQDRHGAVWVAANDGLARFDGNAWQRIGADWSFPGQHAHAVFLDRAGNLWASNEERLFFLPAGTRHFVDTGIAVDRVNQISQAPDGSIWLAERYGGTLRRIVQRDHLAVEMLTVIERANALLFDRNGAIWVGTSGAGIRYVPGSHGNAAWQPAPIDTAHAFSSRDGLSADVVRSMLEDGEGNIWIGTSAGLDRLRPRATVVAGFPKHALNFALAPDADGGVVAGTSNLPAMRLSGAEPVQLDVPAPIHSAVRSLDGTVWLAGSHGIWRVRNDRAERVASLPTSGEPDSAVRAMTLDHGSTPWVSINRAGLYRLRDGHWSRLAPPNSDPSQLMPVSASTDGQGRLWFGYRNNLIVTFDAAAEGDTGKQWGASDGLQIGHVTAMLHQSDRTWVGGQRGLAWFDGQRFHSLPLPDNGLFDNIYAIVATPNGAQPGDGDYDLWLHSKGGIFQLTAAELRRAVTHPGHDIRYRSHDLMGGLANDPHQVLPIPTAVRSTDGRLWFSTSAGVISIDPAQFVQKHATVQPVIQAFTVDGKGFPTNQSVRLPPGPGRIEIAYTAINLSGHPGLHFRFQLEGVDSDWQQVGVARKAIYNDLGPGDYRFRVRATNRDGLLSDDEAVLSFSIPPVFYRSPLFFLLCGIAAAGALWMLHRFNMRRSAEQLRARLEERHAERERIARELHDTLLQGVHGLMLNLQAATESLPPAHPARHKMAHALERADLVVIEARERLGELRDVNDPGVDLVAALTTLADGLQAKSATTFTICTQGMPRPLHPIVAEESYRIGSEALLNAFRHANARNVDIRLVYTRQAFQLCVADNGDGIDPKHLPPNARPGHWGLHGMFERARKAGGKLSAEPGALGGTVIELTVPASTAYRRRRHGARWSRALFGSGTP